MTASLVARYLNSNFSSTRVESIIVDGHALWPCGCAWNVRLKCYTKNCLDYTGRTDTPPHPTEEFLNAERAVRSASGRHRPSPAAWWRRIGAAVAGIRVGRRRAIPSGTHTARSVLRDVSRSGGA